MAKSKAVKKTAMDELLELNPEAEIHELIATIEKNNIRARAMILDAVTPLLYSDHQGDRQFATEVLYALGQNVPQVIDVEIADAT